VLLEAVSAKGSEADGGGAKDGARLPEKRAHGVVRLGLELVGVGLVSGGREEVRSFVCSHSLCGINHRALGCLGIRVTLCGPESEQRGLSEVQINVQLVVSGDRWTNKNAKPSPSRNTNSTPSPRECINTNSISPGIPEMGRTQTLSPRPNMTNPSP
jgi:hypothetical protein